jgi:hypothetical protein
MKLQREKRALSQILELINHSQLISKHLENYKLKLKKERAKLQLNALELKKDSKIQRNQKVQ